MTSRQLAALCPAAAMCHSRCSAWCRVDVTASAAKQSGAGKGSLGRGCFGAPGAPRNDAMATGRNLSGGVGAGHVSHDVLALLLRSPGDLRGGPALLGDRAVSSPVPRYRVCAGGLGLHAAGLERHVAQPVRPVAASVQLLAALAGSRADTAERARRYRRRVDPRSAVHRLTDLAAAAAALG